MIIGMILTTVLVVMMVVEQHGAVQEEKYVDVAASAVLCSCC